jgi:chromosome partitioning protein
MLTYAVASFKGGTGKTSTASGLYNALISLEKKALFIDLDPNNNATDYFLRSEDPERISKKNIYHALRGEIQYQASIYTNGRVRIIPAVPNLSHIGIECASDPGMLLRFRSEIMKLGFDFIVIDTPPSPGIELRAALFAADTVITPIGLSRWTLQGFDILHHEIEKVQATIGKRPSIRAIPSIVSSAEAANLREYINLPYVETNILRNNAIKNAATTGQSLRDGTLAHSSFIALAKELIHE